MAKLRPVKRRAIVESEDFIVDKNRIRLPKRMSSSVIRST